MFEAFAQIPRSGPRSPGLGLGLPICHALVELMGGQISYQAVDGGGSVFRVALPLSPVLVSPNEKAWKPDPSQRVLLVEDDAITREVTKAMLCSRGHRVSVAPDSAAAVAMAAESRFDLVLLDLNLGPADASDTDPTGFHTARKIRSIPGPAGQVKLVVLTADAFAGSALACHAEGIHAVIIKPLILADGLKAAIDAARIHDQDQM